MTHDAVITSLLRYTLGVAGSRLLSYLFREVDTMIINIAARKFGGLSRAERVESLHFFSGTRTMSNLFATHCAELLDSCLRAANSAIKTCLEGEVRVYLGDDAAGTTHVRIAIPRELIAPIQPARTP